MNKRLRQQRDLNPRYTIICTSPIAMSAYNGAGGRNRTRNLLITSQLLSRLSYTGIEVQYPTNWTSCILISSAFRCVRKSTKAQLFSELLRRIF